MREAAKAAGMESARATADGTSACQGNDGVFFAFRRVRRGDCLSLLTFSVVGVSAFRRVFRGQRVLFFAAPVASVSAA
jgi:hypothetical protein